MHRVGDQLGELAPALAFLLAAVPLTPLYARIARRADVDPLTLALVPLLLACLASSVLPVSNLTNLVVAEHVDLTTASLLTHLGLPSLAAVVVGWWGYARRHPTRLDPPAVRDLVDRRALRVGGTVVGAVLVGLVLGTTVGFAPWMTGL